MQVKKNVVAAISAALQHYIQAEQQSAAVIEEQRVAEIPRPPFHPWAMAGRQAAMEIRRFWQMRLVR
ncbi:MAG: hypothetical protein RBS57_14655 [Desulforhabdus sp.]|jgi:hypothetical protein|nr:hypothetical protein [Desulforhabdus sp.]